MQCSLYNCIAPFRTQYFHFLRSTWCNKRPWNTFIVLGSSFNTFCSLHISFFISLLMYSLFWKVVSVHFCSLHISFLISLLMYSLFWGLVSILFFALYFLPYFSSFSCIISQSILQRHMLKDRRPSTAACPACRATETQELNICTARKKNFVLGWPEQPRQNKGLSYIVQYKNFLKTIFLYSISLS